ncbi:copper homeostasis membrane protein CopD [Musicola keenii]|uniref:copper homeostasis membrane protein CopD n=1 Tax=Musicola keenii TaxID=2884250 RepID=UPI001785A205|nr:copper homeostasis membrane protein CopD [Musicola keenii]
MTPEWFYVLLRWVHVVALMLLAGGACYGALLSPLAYRARLQYQLRFLLMICCGVTLLSAGALLALQLVLMSGDWLNLRDPAVWQAVLDTRFGQAWRWQPIAALLGCLSFLSSGVMRQRLVLLMALAQLVGMAFTGHAAVLEGGLGMLQRANQALHLIFTAFWVGGLPPLFWLLRASTHPQWRDMAIRTMLRFSCVAHFAVAGSILTGMINVGFISGWPLDFSLRYNQLLALKVVLVVLMVGIALFNRYWVVPRFRCCTRWAERWFFRLTSTGMLLALLVLVLVSDFATRSPG